MKVRKGETRKSHRLCIALLFHKTQAGASVLFPTQWVLQVLWVCVREKKALCN